MIFPLSANKIEQLDLDPQKKVNGYIWFNRVEKVYKTWVDNTLHVFMTDKRFEADIDTLVDDSLSRHEFVVTFTEAYQVIIKHNKGKVHFTYNVFDDIENCNLSSSMEIINDNEISVDFIDPVTGSIFLYFE